MNAVAPIRPMMVSQKIGTVMIHHTTKKSALAHGILLEEAPEGSNFRFKAFWKDGEREDPTHEVELWGDNLTTLTGAMKAAKMMVLEYGVSFDQDDETGQVTITVGTKNPRVVGKVELADDLPSVTADVLEALTSGEVDEISEADAADAAEEELRSGSVVPDKYKERYREDGHPNNCGDWLADTLGPLTTNNQGKLDVDAMEEVARLNGIDTSKLNRTSPGWQGRFRMTARNMLVKKVVASGFLSVPASENGDTVKAPGDWLLANAPKVKEAGNKKAARKAAGA